MNIVEKVVITKCSCCLKEFVINVKSLNEDYFDKAHDELKNSFICGECDNFRGASPEATKARYEFFNMIKNKKEEAEKKRNIQKKIKKYFG